MYLLNTNNIFRYVLLHAHVKMYTYDMGNGIFVNSVAIHEIICVTLPLLILYRTSLKSMNAFG